MMQIDACQPVIWQPKLFARVRLTAYETNHAPTTFCQGRDRGSTRSRCGITLLAFAKVGGPQCEEPTLQDANVFPRGARLVPLGTSTAVCVIPVSLT